jgi:hypothetical protein
MDRAPGRPRRMAEDVVGDLAAWGLLLLGVVVGLGLLGAVTVLTSVH